MNVERLEYLANWLAAGAGQLAGVVGFNLARGIHLMESSVEGVPECGTTCCIAGAACEFFDAPFVQMNMFDEPVYWAEVRGIRPRARCLRQVDFDKVKARAMELLGIDGVTADELFYAFEYLDVHYSSIHSDARSKIKADHAARCIRKYIATGKVDWLGTDCPDVSPLISKET